MRWLEAVVRGWLVQISPASGKTGLSMYSGMVESPHTEIVHIITGEGWEDGRGAEVCGVFVAAKERIALTPD